MNNLSSSEKTHMSSVYSISLTGKNFSGLPPDQVMEMTMNKESKNRRGGGWIGFTKNPTMITTSILIRPMVMMLRESFSSLLGINKPTAYHPELGPSRIQKDETVVLTALSALREWNADPWDLSQPSLRSLTSGRVATNEVVQSLHTAHTDGNKVVDNFFARLTQGRKSVYAAISKRKSLTFATLAGTNKPSKSEHRMTTDRTAIRQLINLFTDETSSKSCRNNGNSRLYYRT